MTLANIAAEIGGTIGLTDAASLTKIKGYLKRRYALICAGALWKDLLAVYPKSVAAGQTAVVFPSHITDLVECKIDNNGLTPVDQMFLFRSYAELWAETGTPTHWSELAPIATLGELTAAEKLRCVSGSGSDTSDVQIHGEDANGNPLSETVTLQGFSQVLTVNDYLTVYGISKATTVGTITVLGNTSAVTFQTLKPTENQKLHRRLRLHTIPGSALTLLVLAKRAPAPFASDNDSIVLPAACELALQAFAHGDALQWQRQYGKAQGLYAEALALLNEAKASEAYQAKSTKRMTPATSLAEGCSPYDFL